MRLNLFTLAGTCIAGLGIFSLRRHLSPGEMFYATVMIATCLSEYQNYAECREQAALSATLYHVDQEINVLTQLLFAPAEENSPASEANSPDLGEDIYTTSCAGG